MNTNCGKWLHLEGLTHEAPGFQPRGCRNAEQNSSTCYTPTMQRRWIIRGTFIALLALSLIAWIYGSHVDYRYAAIVHHRPAHAYTACHATTVGVHDGRIFAQSRISAVNIPVLYVDCAFFGGLGSHDSAGGFIFNPRGIRPYTQSQRWRLRLGFDLRMSLPPPHGDGPAVMFPLWFPVSCFSGLLIFIWRKTRRPATARAFTVET